MIFEEVFAGGFRFNLPAETYLYIITFLGAKSTFRQGKRLKFWRRDLSNAAEHQHYFRPSVLFIIGVISHSNTVPSPLALASI